MRYRCPKCKSERHLEIVVPKSYLLSADQTRLIPLGEAGIEVSALHDGDRARCLECGFRGELLDFESRDPRPAA